MLAALTLIAASAPIVPPLSFDDRKARVTLRGEIAAEIKGEIGAPADHATAAVVDRGIKKPPVEIVACSHVDHGIAADRSTIGVIDREVASPCVVRFAARD